MKRFWKRTLPPLLLGAGLGAVTVWLLLSRSLVLTFAGRGPAGSPPPGEEWRITARDGVTLRASARTAGTGEKWVLLLHGRGETGKSQEELGEAYRLRGWSTLIPDLRGCGGSGGAYRGLGTGDGPDVLAWMARIREERPKARIVLHGTDLGANAALAAAGERPPGLLAVVADSPVSDLRSTLARAGLLEQWGAAAVLRLMTGRDLLSPSLKRQTAGTGVPILFLLWEGDDPVPAEEAGSLFFLARRGSRLLRRKRGLGDAWQEALFGFLTDCSGSPGTP